MSAGPLLQQGVLTVPQWLQGPAGCIGFISCWLPPHRKKPRSSSFSRSLENVSDYWIRSVVLVFVNATGSQCVRTRAHAKRYLTLPLCQSSLLECENLCTLLYFNDFPQMPAVACCAFLLGAVNKNSGWSRARGSLELPE